MTRHRFRFAALLLALAMVLLSAVDATAAGPKRIFITKTDENFMGQAGVTFELYEDTDGDGVRDDGEPKLQTKVTDAAGSATFDPVNPGKYIVHEVTPAGYVDNPDQAVEIPDAKGRGPTIVFSNTPKPANSRVNDPTGDTSFGDGTHVFDFGASLAVVCEEEQRRVAPTGIIDDCDILAAWNHSAGFQSPGGFSGSMSGFSTDLGQTWGDYTKAPTGGSNTGIFGEPQVVWDPTTNRFYYVNDAITNTAEGVQRPIMISSSGGSFGFWNNPVNATPDIPLSPSLAHGPSMVVDPVSGDLVMAFTLSHDDGTSETMTTRSTDGGNSWTIPVAVSDREHHDFVDLAIAPNRTMYTTWTDFSDPNDTSFLVSQSTDNGRTWQPVRTVAIVPKSGTPGLCQDSSARTVLGEVVPFDAPEVAVDPFRPNRVFVTYPGHGEGTDESDIFLSRSTDGGRTWTQVGTVGPTPGTQFSPTMDITPDGRLAVAFYDATAAPTPEVDWTAAFFDIFGANPQSVDAFAMQLSEQPSLLWEMNPSFDSNFNNCFGMPPGDLNAAGSGFFTAWTDGRDPGPAGNNGIDPNIYFAQTEGPLLATELEVSVRKTATKVNVTGAVVPQPLPGARVTVTLFRSDGGAFDQIARKRPRTGNGGAWETSFGRPSGGRCRVVVEFGGAEGRQPSVPVTKTFAC